MKIKLDIDKRIIEVDGQQISNFTITKLQNNEIYLIDNGKIKRFIALITGSLLEFRRKCTEQGNFWFAGSKKQLDAVLFVATCQFEIIP